MTKLLNRPLRAFALYSLVILVISIPVYVYVMDYIWIKELDENNWLILQHTKEKLQSKEFLQQDLEQINQIWGEIRPGLSIVPSDVAMIRPDSIYEAIRPNKYDTNDGEDRFRGLKSYLEIRGEIYQITIETNVEESDETFLAVAIVTFFFFIVLIIGFLLLNWRIAASSWKPFYQTLRSLKSFELSKGENLDLTSTSIQEFQELNQALQKLVEGNIAAYQLQKSFVENASHELQTPIALLKSKLDLLMQEGAITPQISELLSSIEVPLSRLSRINKNLLLLAKVENRQYKDQEALDVKEYVESSLMLFEDYIANKSLKVQNHLKEPLQVSANSFLLETLLHNLLSNAIRHTAEGGALIIKQQDRTLLFCNSGDQALRAEHLFERFSRVSNDKVSSGLGLAIIKEIANKYNWKVGYRFDDGRHIFLVRL